MKKIAVIHVGDESRQEKVAFLGQTVEVERIGCGGDVDQARKIITEFDGRVDAVALEGLPAYLELGPRRVAHETGVTLPEAARKTPVVDGSGIRDGLERWGVILADKAQPGIFSQKRVLMVPGLNHNGLASSLARRGSAIRYADPTVFFALPPLPGIGTRPTLGQAAPRTLSQLRDAPFRRLYPQPGVPGTARSEAPFAWADLLAGDIGAIRRYSPPDLRYKTIVVESADEADAEALRERGAAILVTLMPGVDRNGSPAKWSAAAIEGLLVALRTSADSPLSEDTYLDLLADIEWQPAIHYLQPDEAGINRFAFVIHPLDVRFVHGDRRFSWTRYLPDSLVESVAAYLPPIYLSRITGGQSPTTGQRIEGHLLSLGATPRQMMAHGERFTYDRLNKAARKAERLGARIMGLGAFTSVVGDAGITVAHESGIAITSGNSLTVAATLEAAKQAAIWLGVKDLTKGRVMIIGATGSIGSICSRLLAQAIFDVVLVSIEPEKLIELKRTIQAETPSAQVTIATRPDKHLGACDLVVTATSAFGQRILDISLCKPGAVICDVARPPDIGKKEAALRPDVLVIESGEVLIPGEIDFGYDIGLPPKTAYACLAETALLAMEGRFEDYTLGRNISVDRVKEIYRLFKKHEFGLAPLRSFDEYVTDEMIAKKRALADALRDDPMLFSRTQEEAAAGLAKIPVAAKGVRAKGRTAYGKVLLVSGSLLLAALLFRRRP